MPEILFIKSSNTTFIKNDEIIIKKYFSVSSFLFTPSKKFINLMQSQLEMISWLLKNIWSCKIVYIWFADYHSLLPVLFARILGKKSMIVIGGFDVARIPEIHYGGHLNRIRSIFIRLSLRYASLLLPVSKFTEQELLQINGKTPRIMIYNGVNLNIFKRDMSIPKQKMVLSVGLVREKWAFITKGFDLYIEVAKMLPDIRFLLAGIQDDALPYLKKLNPGPNVEIYNYLDQKELVLFYNQASVYCQFSRHESFCLALAEAMLCECVPIITRNGALPEVIGDTGYIVRYRDAQPIASIVLKAMEAAQSERNKISRQIELNFSLEKRENHLRQIISSI